MKNNGFGRIEGIIAAGILAIVIGVYAKGSSSRVQRIQTPEYELCSDKKGIAGHETYIRFADGSQSLTIHGSSRMASRKLYEDLNGDGHVQRIRTMTSGLTQPITRDVYVSSNGPDANYELQAEADSMMAAASANCRF